MSVGAWRVRVLGQRGKVMSRRPRAAWAVATAVPLVLALSLAACQGGQEVQREPRETSASDATAPSVEEVVEPSTSAQDGDAQDDDAQDGGAQDGGAGQEAGLTDYTGTLGASNTPQQVSVSMGDGILSLSGQVSASPDGGLSSYVLGYDDATEWVGSGGEAPDQELSPSEFKQLLEAQNGLGLTLQVSEGRVVRATLSS